MSVSPSSPIYVAHAHQILCICADQEALYHPLALGRLYSFSSVASELVACGKAALSSGPAHVGVDGCEARLAAVDQTLE
jgi:hypothetical protein